jgi:hypothetical protein
VENVLHEINVSTFGDGLKEVSVLGTAALLQCEADRSVRPHTVNLSLHRETPAVSEIATDAGASAAPWPQSGGCARG